MQEALHSHRLQNLPERACSVLQLPLFEDLRGRSDEQVLGEEMRERERETRGDFQRDESELELQLSDV